MILSLSLSTYISIYLRNISISYSITKNIMRGLIQPCDTSVYMYIFNVASHKDPFHFPLWRTINKTRGVGSGRGGIPFCCQLRPRRRPPPRAPRDSCSIISMSFDLDIGTSTANYYSLLSYAGFLCPFQLLIIIPIVIVNLSQPYYSRPVSNF